MPLPPYIAGKRAADARDRDDYQTMFAREEGAVAAPTAALHFTPALMAALAEAGIGHETLTLHVGAGTFLPVKADDTDGPCHARRMGPDRRRDGGPAQRGAGRGRPDHRGRHHLAAPARKRRRTRTGRIRPFEGDTAIFITPGYRFRAVDGLITNFHLPRSTLFMLVSALMGLETMQAAYAHAIARGLPLLFLWRREPAAALADRDALPEGDPVPDLGGGRLGVGIIPGGVAVLGAVDLEVVIMGDALPRADRVVSLSRSSAASTDARGK